MEPLGARRTSIKTCPRMRTMASHAGQAINRQLESMTPISRPSPSNSARVRAEIHTDLQLAWADIKNPQGFIFNRASANHPSSGVCVCVWVWHGRKLRPPMRARHTRRFQLRASLQGKPPAPGRAAVCRASHGQAAPVHAGVSGDSGVHSVFACIDAATRG